MTEAIDFHEMNRKVIDEFRTNEGKGSGIFADAPLILVHHVGAKSGIERVAPLVYFAEGERLFIYASKGGSDENPAWYHNLVANPETKVEVGTETFPVTAKVLQGAERDEYYAKMSAVQPQFADYQSKTSRTIPVIELVRV
ncbi:nitroreductase family deazaflavin-dependent oxidoreductase [Nocardia miyunensis]|uniref:nitroreductase family deazaflavin-dependent oxidoreductase n=1 Tax=Nocardia miyunensis TaxID=282684 RepID=UPI00082DAEF6|nr:nitroreductase family deazaflavin-dependent oxidoreductase [Nocardia miyunensis]